MRCGSGVLSLLVIGAAALAGQTQAPEGGKNDSAWRKVDESSQTGPKLAEQRPAQANLPAFTIASGTHIPLALINSVSTKHSVEGDRIYLQTVYPVVVQNRIVIPAGSYVEGTLTEVKRPGRAKNRRGEMFLRFDSLTLPNGVTRDFRSRLGGVDGTVDEEVDRSEGKIKAKSNKSGDAGVIAEGAGIGATVGTIAGATRGSPLTGLGIGAAAGAGAGLLGVLLSRGPDAVLARGTTVEMVLDRPVSFDEKELDFSRAAPPVPIVPAAAAQTETRRWPL